MINDIAGNLANTFVTCQCSGGSRISRRGGRGPRTGGHGPPRQLRFKNFACQNERIWTRRGGRAPGAPPPRSANAVILFVISNNKENVIVNGNINIELSLAGNVKVFLRLLEGYILGRKWTKQV